MVVRKRPHRRRNPLLWSAGPDRLESDVSRAMAISADRRIDRDDRAYRHQSSICWGALAHRRSRWMADRCAFPWAFGAVSHLGDQTIWSIGPKNSSSRRITPLSGQIVKKRCIFRQPSVKERCTNLDQRERIGAWLREQWRQKLRLGTNGQRFARPFATPSGCILPRWGNIKTPGPAH